MVKFYNVVFLGVQIEREMKEKGVTKEVVSVNVNNQSLEWSPDNTPDEHTRNY